MLELLRGSLQIERTAFHFHDTFGHAIANVELAFDQGIRIFDSAAGGLGGCPFAPGASGNVATETVVSAMEHRGIPTGIDKSAVERAVAAVLAERIDDAPIPV